MADQTAMKTKLRLAAALKEAGADAELITRALEGRYDDYESPSPTPIMDLVRDCFNTGREPLRLVGIRAMHGEFDATRDEAREWAKHKLNVEVR